ncbi:endoplasmic reticulum vesicle transporter-domain-containing protein [Dichotomocladium elegans]|nr:endoplasmic reticulum vesicle transporter-domain-containing protein [Dichotomocladium elegans]
MPRKSLLHRFRLLDAYAKPLDDIRVRTASGAYVTLISGIIILVLSLYEISQYLTPEMHPEIIVDSGTMTKMPITFNITFPHLPCYMLSLDLMDESGDHIMDYDHDVFKVRLDEHGTEILREKATELSNKMDPTHVVAANNEVSQEYCGPCYGAKRNDGQECCNTCDDVRRAYADDGWRLPDESQIEQCVRENVSSQTKEGCNIHGHLMVSRVRGNFHFSPGKSFAYGGAHIHDVRTYLAAHHDFSHEIHSLQFGEQSYQQFKQKRTEMVKLTNALDNTAWGTSQPSIMYQYFLKIVPSQIDYLNGKTLHTYQYSVSRQERDLAQQSGNGLPGM